MSPEEWLAQQSEKKPKTGLSPEDWLAQQTQTEQTQAAQDKKLALSPEAWLAKQSAKPVAEEEAGDFWRGVGNVPGQIQETYGAAKTLAGLLVNSKDTIQSGMEHMESGKERQTGKESDSFTNAWEKGIGTVVTDWLPYQIGSGIGNIAETLVFMGVGALGGGAAGAGVGAVPGAIAGAVSKQLVKKGIKEAAEKMIETQTRAIGKEAAEKAAKEFVEAETKRVILEASSKAAGKEYAKAGAKSYGATTAAVAQAGMHGAGEVTGRAIEEAEKQGKGVEDINLAKVLPAAIVHGVADYFVNKIGLGALKIGEKSAENIAIDVAKRIAVTGTKEVPAELIQQVAERYGAELSLTDAEALKEYIDTIAASYGMSIGPGAVGGVKTNFAHKVALNAKQFSEADADLKGLSTSAGKAKTDVAPPLDPDLIAGLTPSMDASGKSFAALSADTAKSTQDVKDAEASAAQEQQTKLDTAQAYVAKVDAGEKPTKAEVNAIGKSLGIKFPQAVKSNVAKLEMIREHLNKQGAPSATTTTATAVTPAESVEPTDRDNTKLAVPSKDITQTGDGGPAGPVASGMVSDGTTAGPTVTGEVTQSSALDELKAKKAQLTEQRLKLFGGSDKKPSPKSAKGVQLAALNAQTMELDNEIQKLEADLQATTPTPTEVIDEEAIAGPKTIESLSPELQEKVAAAQDKIAQLEMEGSDASKQKRNLNKFLADNGITGGLSAKPTVSQLPRILGPGDEKTDEQVEAERVTAYQDSLGKTIPDYQISDEDKRLYNETRDEVNAQVDTANETRRELVKNLDDAMSEYDKLVDSIDTEKDADAQFTALEPKIKAALDKAKAAEAALKAHGIEQHKLPEYDKKFATDYKDVYFGNIQAPSDKLGGSGKAEHRKAAKALQEYMRRMGGRNKEQLSPQERRIANHYEENRAEYQKLYGVAFPVWSSLTPAQKTIFVQEMMNNSGQMQDMAFAKLGVKLTQDSREMSEGEKREKQNAIERQAEVTRASEEQQQKDRKIREAYDRNKPSNSTLPNSVVQMVVNNDLQGILGYMSSIKTSALTSPYKRIMKAVAQSLLDMKLNTKIVIVESSQLNGDLAQYQPTNDTIYITREGLSSNTILHEIVHAGTVKVINEYLNGNRKSLSMSQLNAIKQLEKIMNETRGALAADHPDAYKNLFEFVSYALTSDQLQQDLHDQSTLNEQTTTLMRGVYGKAEADIATNLPESKSQWSKFKLSIARILKVRDVYLKKSGELSKDVDPNYVLEIAAAFEDILVKPTEPIYLPALPSVSPTAPPPEKKVKTHNVVLGEESDEYKMKADEVPRSNVDKVKDLGKVSGWQKVAKIFQDDRYFVKAWERTREMADQVYREGKDKMNNIYEQIVLAAGDARNFYTAYISEPAKALDQAVSDFAQSAGYEAKRALEELHKIVEIIHEPERRFVKYILSVPLSDVENITHNGKQISAAQRRADILKLLDNHRLSEAQAKQLREELENIIFERDASGNFILVTQDKDGNFVPDPNGYPKPNLKHVDPLGTGPRTATDKASGARIKRNINMESELYNATGVTLSDARVARQALVNHPQKAEIARVIATLQELHKQTAALNKLANYWSQPVSNRVSFYGFKNYVPLKGKPNRTEVDDDIDFNSTKMGKELQDNEGSMDGRFSVSSNPILQTLSDATRASMRAGRRNLTQAIKNSLGYDKEKNPHGQGILEGHVKQTIKFEERNTVDLSDLKGETTIFHYNDDGSIDILVITNERLRDSIRRTYTHSNWATNVANKITSKLGQLHTRYNYQFAPMNFIRDTLTNAWNIGASELGPIQAAKYLKDVAFQVVAKQGMYKSMQVAVLYQKGDDQSLKALNVMAKKDPYIRDMLEYIRTGGMVTHLEGMSLQSTFEELNRRVGKSGIITAVDDLNMFVDAWSNMFELASRGAAYSVAKSNYMSKGMTEHDAKIKAAVFTKNLANFEQVGEWGRGMGALYMFFRPSATGAVRAIEAAAPAFTPLSWAEKRLPPDIANNPVAKAKYLENYKILQRNSRIMVTALTALGMFGYAMAQMTADDDDLGRNAVATDNMEQWTRFLRFHIPSSITDSMGINEPVVFQIPWGFGLGAFAASGAQLYAAGAGAQDWSKAFANIFTSIALDSFVPIPVSRMSAPDNPMVYFVDSIAPSFVRPIVEFAMNKNGLGQDINSTSQRRMGDAYTGGDNVPEMWKDAAAYIHDETTGEWDVSPNTLYFLSNNYIDGISRIGETLYGISDLAQGRKDFSPRQDVPLLGSFFGTRSNYDARQFGEVEKKIQQMERIMNDFKDNPEKLAEYTEKYPMAEFMVDTYNKQVNRELNPLRHEDKLVRLNKQLAPVDRKALIQMNTFQENLIKSQIVDMYKSYVED